MDELHNNEEKEFDELLNMMNLMGEDGEDDNDIDYNSLIQTNKGPYVQYCRK